jgi:ABC-2 type transport system ATP-binding protein
VDQNTIELVGLTKKYGEHAVVDDLNLTISKSEIFGLLGPNGAGKSTTILMLLGMTDPTSGFARVCGIDPTREPIDVKKRVGYLPEDVGFYDDYTGLENLVYTARLNRIPTKDAYQRAEQMLRRVGLTDATNKKAGKYSRGMRQRLGLADVLIKNPEVIILDEPTLGIDPKGVQELLELIVQLSKEEGLTVLLSSHDLHQVQKICDRVGLFVKGKLLAEGNVRTLSQHLFSNEPFTIEAGISTDSPEVRNGHQVSQMDRLQEALLKIEGVMNVNFKSDSLQINCSRDASTDIARAIVGTGAGLNFLHKIEYGLDEIYYHYFKD